MKNSIPMEQAIRLALEQHQAGNYGRAEALYLEILHQDPGNIDAMHLLGVLARQGGRPDIAVEMISRAISRRGDAAIFHYNLGDAFTALGRTEEAIASFERAIELNPADVTVYVNLSSILLQKNHFLRAEPICRRGLTLDPENVSLLNNLGMSLRGQQLLDAAREQFHKALAINPKFAESVTNLAMCACAESKMEEGEGYFRQAVSLRPASADTHNNLGTVLVTRHKLDEALVCFQTAVDIKNDHVEAINNLGSVLRSMGKPDLAMHQFQKAVQLKPEFVEGHANLAAAFGDLNRNEEALASLDRAIALRPHVARMYYLRGILLRNLRRLDEGIAAIRKCLELEPTASDALTTLGYALLEQGDMEGALDALTRSAGGRLDPVSHSNVLMTINYHPGISRAQQFAMHRRWSELHELPFQKSIAPHTNDRSPNRRLRIGYVSPDFRGHSVAYFLEPILENHDREEHEIFGYAHVTNFDMNTYRLRTMIDHWRETSGKSPAEIETMIRDDQIDILVELAGHTGGNLLPVFARKPAPVQINMIGFPSTTGLSAIDYRITDALSDPPGETEAFNSETLIRMPRIFWVYQPPNTSIEVGALPADDNGRLTFTSVNNFTKVTPAVQSMWAQLLHATPNSRLIIQTSAMGSASMQDLVRTRFAAAGVETERLEFRPWSDLNDYLKLLERSDITLDPFPFNGGTTTCHSLWMGAPVLTLAGDRHASRMGLSMMTAVGLPEFVAYSPEEYVEIGRRMANELPRLREIRSGMRERLKNSPLLDGPGYTRELETVFRQAWQKWCGTNA